MGFTVLYLSLIVLIPLSALIARPWEHGWSGFWAVITDTRVLAALRLSFGTARHMLENRRLHLEIAFLDVKATDGLPEEILLAEEFARLRVRKKIEIPTT